MTRAPLLSLILVGSMLLRVSDVSAQECLQQGLAPDSDAAVDCFFETVDTVAGCGSGAQVALRELIRLRPRNSADQRRALINCRLSSGDFEDVARLLTDFVQAMGKDLAEADAEFIESTSESLVKAEAEARQDREEQARRDREEQARRDREEQARRDREEQARRDREEQERRDREEQARRDREEQARRDREEQARRDREEQERRDREEREREEEQEREEPGPQPEAGRSLSAGLRDEFRRRAEEAARQDIAAAVERVKKNRQDTGLPPLSEAEKRELEVRIVSSGNPRTFPQDVSALALKSSEKAALARVNERSNFRVRVERRARPRFASHRVSAAGTLVQDRTGGLRAGFGLDFRVDDLSDLVARDVLDVATVAGPGELCKLYEQDLLSRGFDEACGLGSLNRALWMEAMVGGVVYVPLQGWLRLEVDWFSTIRGGQALNSSASEGLNYGNGGWEWSHELALTWVRQLGDITSVPWRARAVFRYGFEAHVVPPFPGPTGRPLDGRTRLGGRLQLGLYRGVTGGIGLGIETYMYPGYVGVSPYASLLFEFWL